MLHQSVIDRISNKALTYRPQNNRGNGTDLCLLDKEGADLADLVEVREPNEPDDLIKFHNQFLDEVPHVDRLHRIYTFEY